MVRAVRHPQRRSQAGERKKAFLLPAGQHSSYHLPHSWLPPACPESSDVFQKALLEMKPLQGAVGTVWAGLHSSSVWALKLAPGDSLGPRALSVSHCPRSLPRHFLCFSPLFLSAWLAVPAAWWAGEVHVSQLGSSFGHGTALAPAPAAERCLWCHAHLYCPGGHWSEESRDLHQGFLQESAACSWKWMPCAWAQISQCTDG